MHTLTSDNAAGNNPAQESLSETLGANVMRLRNEQRLSKKTFALMVGISRMAITEPAPRAVILAEVFIILGQSSMQQPATVPTRTFGVLSQIIISTLESTREHLPMVAVLVVAIGHLWQKLMIISMLTS